MSAYVALAFYQRASSVSCIGQPTSQKMHQLGPNPIQWSSSISDVRPPSIVCVNKTEFIAEEGRFIEAAQFCCTASVKLGFIIVQILWSGWSDDLQTAHEVAGLVSIQKTSCSKGLYCTLCIEGKVNKSIEYIIVGCIFSGACSKQNAACVHLRRDSLDAIMFLFHFSLPKNKQLQCN